MAVEHARSGEPLALQAERLGESVTLVRDARLEVMRWALPAGRGVPAHRAYGPATVHCLRGEVTLRVGERCRTLAAGALVYLAAGEPHALQADSDAVLLVSMVLVAAGAPGGAGGGAPVHGERADAPGVPTPDPAGTGGVPSGAAG